MSSSSGSDHSDDEGGQRTQIREELSSMSFEEILKLKEELGAKVYNEAVLGVDSKKAKRTKTDKKEASDFKRLNKNRPRELSAKWQVPFLGDELRAPRKRQNDNAVRDPRFDERAGTYDVASFKTNYRFISKIRHKEVGQLREELNKTTGEEERAQLKQNMQRLINKNVEERNWHAKRKVLKKEQQDIQKAINEGKQPHYVTNKERRTRELVEQFEHLKKTGKLDKHLEKRRKKNTAKDRKRIGFD